MSTLPSDTVLQVTSAIVPRIYHSRWSSVTQDQIDAFAAATGDNQWIHRTSAEQDGSPFHGPIAHGLLLVSLAITLARECGALEDATWVLYGVEKLRFRAPVRSGVRIRCLTTIKGLQQLAGRTLLQVRFVMEIEDQKIPALVADCLLLHLTETQNSPPGVCAPSSAT
jgi:acyl dehydratase